MKTELYIEAFGKKTEYKVLLEKIKDLWKEEGRLVKELKKIEVYYKPEEAMCYYVVNDKINGSFPV